MPYLVTRTSWPSDKIPEIVKTAIEVIKKYPEDTSLGETVVPNAVKATTDGIMTFAVYEVKEGKFREAYERAGTVLAMYAPIEGFEYSVEVWSTEVEAYKTIGQAPPG
ncbi:MAG: hypothetical protein ACXAEX_00485 [Promethearchaeota archaeon]